MNERGFVTRQAAERPGPARAMWAEAAVRETYQPNSLLTRWLAQHDGESAATQAEAVRTTLELQALGRPVRDKTGDDALQLPLENRLDFLAALGARSALQALSNIPTQERTNVEKALFALLAGEGLATDRDDHTELVALQTAATWARGAGASISIEPEDIVGRLRRIDFLRTLGGSDLHRFVGRGPVRRSLEDAWRSTSAGSKFLYLEGPGGIGKSLTVARFLADLFDSTDHESWPRAVYHLDFDRLPLQTARLATVLQDIVYQSATWLRPAAKDELLELAQSTYSGGSEIEPASYHSRSSEAARDDLSIVRRLSGLLRIDSSRPRVIVFVDSFEQVEAFDSVAASSPGRVIKMFEACGVHVLAIYASRAFKDGLRRRGEKLVRLRQFTQREADAYLVNEASRNGFNLQPGVGRRVQESIGRSPLALRLAVSLLEKSTGDFDIESWGTAAGASPEAIQAALYDRLLKRLRSPELRKIAVPGLLVRRLTSDVISEVLAGPCSLDLEKASPQALMELAWAEGQLFVRHDSDPQAAWHRQDVRATMLKNLERTTGPALMRAINEAAVQFYAERGTSTLERTEELYHRLRLCQAADKVDERWTEDAGAALRSAMAELPSSAQRYLRVKLGAALARAPVASSAMLSLRDADPSGEDEYRLLVAKESQSGRAIDVDRILERWQAQGGRLDVPLGDVYAQALFRKGQFDRLQSGARDLLTSPATGMSPAAMSSVMSLAAASFEGRDALADALTFWMKARSAADRGKDERVVLSCLVGSIRARRKLGTGAQERRTELGRSLGLLESLGTSVYRRRVLAREAGAELGEVLFDVRSPFLRPVQLLIESVVGANEAFPSTVDDPDRLRELCKQFGSRGPSLRGLNETVFKLLYASGEQARKVVNAIRLEVDWTLRQAISRQSGLRDEA